jgi:DNA-binding transcriptional MerR regulator
MIGYSIKDLERLSGVKAHTIRIWEKRYKIIEPNRTNTNIRQYNDDDLKKILNISILKSNGYKISEIASLSNTELSDHVLSLTSNAKHYETQINNLILSMIELDDKKFDKILTNSTVRLGFEDTIVYIIYPFLEKIGILWQIGSINAAQEHFVSNLLRQKIMVAIDGQISGISPESKRIMLFLPESEFHEIGLLFYAYLVKKHGHKIIYLGQSVPFDDLLEIKKIKTPDILVTSVTAALDPDATYDYLLKLHKHFPEQKILITGLKARQLNKTLPPNILLIQDVTEFKEKLELR